MGICLRHSVLVALGLVAFGCGDVVYDGGRGEDLGRAAELGDLPAAVGDNDVAEPADGVPGQPEEDHEDDANPDEDPRDPEEDEWVEECSDGVWDVNQITDIRVFSDDDDVTMAVWDLDTWGFSFVRLFVRGWDNEQASVCVGEDCLGPHPDGIAAAAADRADCACDTCGHNNAYYGVDFDVSQTGGYVTVMASDPKLGQFGQLGVVGVALHNGELGMACQTYHGDCFPTADVAPGCPDVLICQTGHILSSPALCNGESECPDDTDEAFCEEI